MLRQAIAGLVFITVLAGGATAADISGEKVYRTYGPVCGTPKVPSVINLPTIQDMMNEIIARYVTAAETSEMEGVQANRSTRYQWAVQARAACGIAIGYLRESEINPERLWNCECYYERMGGPVVSVRY